MNVINVVLADDHRVVRAGLRALIDAQQDMLVVGEASDGIELLGCVEQTQPDVVVLDLSMPNLNGLETARRLQDCAPNTHILMLSVHEDATYVRQALEAGAIGYVLKRAAAELLIDAIRYVGAGGIFFDPALSPTLAQSITGTSKTASDSLPLSEREEVVLRLVAQGYSNKEIAARLDLSVKTIETYKVRATEKLGLTSRVDIVRYASINGWLNQLES
jgi:DNA-binding NarL/FixJ family response regulator